MRGYLLPFILLLVVGSSIGGWLYHRYRVAPTIDMEQISLRDIHGESVNLSQYRGHPLLVNFFASWCGPCMAEMPDLVQLQARYGSNGLHVVCITDEPAIQLQRVALRYPTGVVYLRSDSSHHHQGIYTIPTTYIIDAQGHIRHTIVNATDWNTPTLQSWLKEITNP